MVRRVKYKEAIERDRLYSTDVAHERKLYQSDGGTGTLK